MQISEKHLSRSNVQQLDELGCVSRIKLSKIAKDKTARLALARDPYSRRSIIEEREEGENRETVAGHRFQNPGVEPPA